MADLLINLDCILWLALPCAAPDKLLGREIQRAAREIDANDSGGKQGQ